MDKSKLEAQIKEFVNSIETEYNKMTSSTSKKTFNVNFGSKFAKIIKYSNPETSYASAWGFISLVNGTHK